MAVAKGGGCTQGPAGSDPRLALCGTGPGQSTQVQAQICLCTMGPQLSGEAVDGDGPRNEVVYHSKLDGGHGVPQLLLLLAESGEGI